MAIGPATFEPSCHAVLTLLLGLLILVCFSAFACGKAARRPLPLSPRLPSSSLGSASSPPSRPRLISLE
jgi:hypothetical protein